MLNLILLVKKTNDYEKNNWSHNGSNGYLSSDLSCS